MEITLQVVFFFFFLGVGVGVALVSFMIQSKVVVRTFSELYVENKRGKKRSPGFVFFSEVSEVCCLLLLLVARGWSTRGAGRCHSCRYYLLSYIYISVLLKQSCKHIQRKLFSFFFNQKEKEDSSVFRRKK